MIVITSAKNKKKNDNVMPYNPWAVCSKNIDKKKDPEKHERCVMEIKKQNKKASSYWDSIISIGKLDKPLKKEAMVKKSESIPRSVKNNIIKSFSSAGLDGNGRFEESDSGISVLNNVLKDYGYNLTNPQSKNSFLGDSGRKLMSIEKTNMSDDPFMPGEEVTNSQIVYIWQNLNSGREDANPVFEILVYFT